jgi:hypothetical protein
MKRRIAFAVALLSTLPAFGQEWKEVDYAKLERKIENEPKYATKEPRYAGFLLDTEGKFLVWVVRDGDDIYVQNKKYTSTKETGQDYKTWNVGSIKVPGTEIVHTDVEFWKRDRSDDLHFHMKWAGKVEVYGGQDPEKGGSTAWGTSPKDAPILRPSPLGELELVSSGAVSLKPGEDTRVCLMAGHTGSRADTFCPISDTYLEAGQDRVFATLIAKDKKGEKIEVKTEITGHC